MHEALAVPGTVMAGDEANGYAVWCAWDAGPIVARILGYTIPPPPLRHPGVSYPGYQKYLELGFAEKLRWYQHQAVEFLMQRAWALHCDPMRCLAGTTRLNLASPAPEGVYVRTLADLVERYKVLSAAGPVKLWSADRARGRVFPNEVAAVHRTGQKYVHTITTGFRRIVKHKWHMPEAGTAPDYDWTGVASIQATADHKFSTPSGYVSVADLRPGMFVDRVVATHRGTKAITGAEVMSISDTLTLVDTYDLTMADPYNNYLAESHVVHNSGKSAGLLASDIMVGSQRTLIVAPALAKWVWAREIAKWTGESALVIEGRRGTESREYCVPCMGQGELPDGRACPSCTGRNGQSYGYTLYEVLGTTRTSIARTEEGARYCPVPQTFHCPLHERQTSLVYDKECPECAVGFYHRLKKARYVLSNYDILIQHHDHDAAGGEHERNDLLGFAGALKRVKFDVAILDEIHKIRGRPTPDRWGKSTRDRLKYAIKYVPIVWGATGTPIYGFTRDYYSILDVVSGGLFGFPHKPFDIRYCEGQYGIHAWEANGSSIYARTELKERLAFFQLKRSRKELFGNADKKQRQVLLIEPSKPLKPDHIANVGPELAYDKGLAVALDDKLPLLLENIANELAEGSSSIVFTKLVESSKRCQKAIEEHLNKRDVATRMRQIGAKVWLANGSVDPAARIAMSDRYRDHVQTGGGGVFVATIDAFQVAASLGGASFVHFVEFGLDPAGMQQAEDRAFEVGCGLLHIYHYVVKRSPDQHARAILLPKLEMQETVTDDAAAADYRATLGGRKKESLTAQAIFERMTAHLRGAHASSADELAEG